MAEARCEKLEPFPRRKGVDDPRGDREGVGSLHHVEHVEPVVVWVVEHVLSNSQDESLKPILLDL
eukprot:CAMPEP_0180184758 /NCGR_PEP_ID=MMETSP0986-20121125/42007_1 /TAXON_ID=697907 /ORGANISM="non described non described, Strain CCMP2293" /LENGTH=64 /DNA_ID=CAMNT_0022138489 /DNA_START=265 /DNA_END=459 /DNA_ORIENTATION=+